MAAIWKAWVTASLEEGTHNKGATGAKSKSVTAGRKPVKQEKAGTA